MCTVVLLSVASLVAILYIVRHNTAGHVGDLAGPHRSDAKEASFMTLDETCKQKVSNTPRAVVSGRLHAVSQMRILEIDAGC